MKLSLCGWILAALPLAAQVPDLSGVWQADNGAGWNILDHRGDYQAPAGKGVVEGNGLPYLPAALAQRADNAKHPERDPLAHCQAAGIPRAVYISPFKIIQTAKEIDILYEYAHAWRIIPLNKEHRKNLEPSWMGDSVGRWDGATLVIDTVGFNDHTWFDMAGNFHSDALHVIERYRLADPRTIAYEATIEDPGVFSKPWKMSFNIAARPDIELQEFECIKR